jgi:hypothetical protein
MKIEKISAQFADLGSKVSLAVPVNIKEVALRLYQETHEIAIFIQVPEPTDLQTSEAMPARNRFFLASPTIGSLPDTFLKFIGAMGFVNGSVREAYIIEVAE